MVRVWMNVLATMPKAFERRGWFLFGFIVELKYLIFCVATEIKTGESVALKIESNRTKHP